LRGVGETADDRPAASDLRNAERRVRNCVRLRCLIAAWSSGTISKKRARRLALLKNCVDPVSPKNSDLVLMYGVTLLLRVGLLPRLGPPDCLAAGLSPES